MQGNKSRDTSPELVIRREAHARGLRYRVNYAAPEVSRRRCDMAFTKVKVAVFIDGCFWHHCPLHRTSPKTNPEYWEAKFTANEGRDRDTTARYQALGWTVLRFWEHESVPDVVDAIAETVRLARPTQERR